MQKVKFDAIVSAYHINQYMQKLRKYTEKMQGTAVPCICQIKMPLQ